MPITQAAIQDIAELTALVNSAYRGSSSQLGWTSKAHLLDGQRIDEETFSEYFKDQNIYILKYTDDNGAIIGSVFLELKGSKLYLGMLTVSPLMQNRGIGKKLLEAAEEFAHTHQCHAITMTVITTRHELIAWYERQGYRATGEMIPFPTDEKFGKPKQHIELMAMEKQLAAY